MSEPAAFLDRDGTINRRPPPHEYVTRLGDFELLPGAVEGIAQLAGCGLVLVVVSNQRGLARGIVSDELLHATEKAMQDALRPLDAEITGFYYCPHDHDEDCGCRKPAPGMLLRAADDLDLDLTGSWMVGDSPSDVKAGAAAGCRTVAVGPEAADEATITAATLAEAAKLICASG